MVIELSVIVAKATACTVKRRVALKALLGGGMTLALGGAAGCTPTAPPPAVAVAPTKPPAAAEPKLAPTIVMAPPTPAPSTAATPAPKVAIKRGGTLQAVEPAIDTLDAHLSASTTYPTYEALFDSMTCLYTDEKSTKSELGPELAASWEQPEPALIVFRLQKGVKFHDGSDWNAEAAKWNLERLGKHAKSVGKDMVDAIDKMEVVDPLTLKVYTKGPSATLPLVLSRAGSQGRTMIISKAASEKLGDDGFDKQPSGTGPYLLDQRVKDERTVLKKNPNYWQKGEDGQPLPYLDQVVLRLEPAKSVVAKELRAGTLDFPHATLPLAEFDGLQSDPKLIIWTPPSMAAFTVLDINARKGVLSNNLKLRQALDMAIDRAAMVQAVDMGKGRPADFWWAPGQIGYDASLPKPKFDPAQAKQLVKDAGFPSGVDILLMPSTNADEVKRSTVLKQMWDAVGFRTTIDAVERLAWVQRVRTFEKWDVGVRSQNFLADPDSHGRNLVSTGAGNYAGWNNPEMDKCMAEGRTTLDAKKRGEIYTRCEMIRLGDLYTILPDLFDGYFAFAKYVKNVKMNWNRVDIRWVWLDK